MGEVTFELCRVCRGYGWVPATAATLYVSARLCLRCRGRGQLAFRSYWTVEAMLAASYASGRPAGEEE